MPICVQEGLPALKQLASENVFAMTFEHARRQDIRPLRIVILNLMPIKKVSETQLLRLLANTPLQIEVGFLHTKTHQSRHTSADHLEVFYHQFSEIAAQRYDGMIVTGAAVDHLPYQEVDYWHELCEIIDWANSHVNSTLYLCWGAMAALYYLYGINKEVLPEKISGIYEHHTLSPSCPLVRGFDEYFYAPHSRFGSVDGSQLKKQSNLQLLIDSAVGFYLAMSDDGRRIFVTGHPEYDDHTLKDEYQRDQKRNLTPTVPVNYFPNNDLSADPRNTWRAHAYLLFSNWLNYYVYQLTPYDLNMLQPLERSS